MRIVLRSAAVLIAIAGVLDPVVARRTTAPLAVELRMPEPSHPGYERARQVRDRIVTVLGDGAVFDGSTEPHAIVLIGDAEVGAAVEARVFAVNPSTPRPAAAITRIQVPPSRSGQSASVLASVRGIGLGGRTSGIDLTLRGAVVASVRHRWTGEDETFEAGLAFAPPGPGVHRVRVNVSTDGTETTVADTAAIVRDEPLRVLAYAPRPSWPLTFVRRSLESDPLFDVASSIRTSRGAMTIVGAAPRSLRSMDPDRFDAVLAGGLEALREGDLEALDRYAAERGGTIVLLPDRQVPSHVRRHFGLPDTEEVLVEKPLDLRGGGVAMKASELLLFASPSLQPLAVVGHANAEKLGIAAMSRGAGRIVLSGALDAWRYRARNGEEFETSWRALVADAASGTPPKVAVRLDPHLSRPDEAVNIIVDVRETEFVRTPGAIRIPAVSASIVDTDGRREVVRLWPGASAGRFEGKYVPARSGRFTVSAAIAGASTDVPLLVESDVVHPVAGESGAPAHAVDATGGVVVSDAGELARALAALDTGTRDTATRPMRSPWWIVPFAALLCGEWTLRRRSGLK